MHDSPDYYQLKLSTFNDDKKTELIGEAWIDLRDIIISGGGQSDQWHQLAYRGKYAGEIRIEITFYDSRPKPEKAPVKIKSAVSAEALTATGGAAGPRAMAKRRPLPSDPVTGKPPPSQPTQEPIQTPPRPQPNPSSSYVPAQSPLQQLEYSTPQGRFQQQPQQQHDRSPISPSGVYGAPSQRAELPPQQYRTPERANTYDDRSVYGAGHPQSFGNQDYGYEQDQYENHMEDQDMLPEDDRPPPPPVHRVRNNSGSGKSPLQHQSSYDSVMPKGTPPTMRHDVLRNEAHRHSSSASFPTAYPGRPIYKAYESAPAAPQASQYGNAGDSDQYASPPRHHSFDARYDPTHRSMQPTVEDVPESPDDPNLAFRRSGSRVPAPQHQYQLQPQFPPDAELEPVPLVSTQDIGSRRSIGPSHEYAAQPDDYNGPSDYSPSTELVRHGRQPSNGFSHPQEVPNPSRSLVRQSQPLYNGANSYGYNDSPNALTYHSELDDTSQSYLPPSIPPSLVPGVDRTIAQEITNRFHEDRQQQQQQQPYQRRGTQPIPVETPPRGRHMIENPPGYNFDSSPVSHGTPSQMQARTPTTYSAGTSPSAARPHPISPGHSPNPNHTIRRKSISPRPPPSEERRLSGVPFGPDSYNELNPVMASSAPLEGATSRRDYDESSGKIITHDGRQVDPSDHLPVESWAPEPEPKAPRVPSLPARPSPGGSEPYTPSSGRRPLRIAGRPQSMYPATSPQQYALPDPSDPATPSPLTSTGRNRLQKKVQHRASMLPMMSGANGSGSVESSPLAPLPLQSRQDNFTPPRLPRAATFDNYSPNENHAPHNMYGVSPPGSGSGYRHSPSGSGPPIPAKVPIALPPAMSGAMQLHDGRRGSNYGARGGDPWGADGGNGQLTLLEEMQRIDIGSGRARRHGAGY